MPVLNLLNTVHEDIFEDAGIAPPFLTLVPRGCEW
jgi:hypothetical protein